jgi:LacI family transcriptional regulator
MANIKDIAAAAGVSISTVSNVLNQKTNMGEKTRQKVLDLCKELHYIPNIIGKNLKHKEIKTILFNFSDFDRSFYLEIINGINDCTKHSDYDLIICTTKSCEKYMAPNMTSGAIILDGCMKDEMLERFAREHYPIVVMDRTLDHPNIKSLTVNNYDPMVEMMEQIVTYGYRNFAFVGGIDGEDNRERFRAFKDVLDIYDIPFLQKNYFPGDYREISGYKAAKIFVSSSELPEIFVCANDNMAIGVIKLLKEQGYRVPEDVAVTGFDNCERSQIMGLTTVSIPNYERGYLAARSLLELIQGKSDFTVQKIPAVIKWRKTVNQKSLLKNSTI